MSIGIYFAPLSFRSSKRSDYYSCDVKLPTLDLHKTQNKSYISKNVTITVLQLLLVRRKVDELAHINSSMAIMYYSISR